MIKPTKSRFLSSRIALALLGGVALSACATNYSEAPIATNFATTHQQKLQAGSHWNAISNDAAESIIASLKLGKGCIAPMPECDRVFVKPAKDSTPFAQAFRTQFITSLVNRGVNVVKTPAGAKEIEFDIQVVKFSPDRLDGKFTSATAIYNGLWAMRGLWVSASPGAAGELAVIAFDANRWLTSELASGPTPQHEVIVTVSASTADQYLGRTTNVYYVADTDQSLYVPKPEPVLRTLSVKGGE